MQQDFENQLQQSRIEEESLNNELNQYKGAYKTIIKVKQQLQQLTKKQTDVQWSLKRLKYFVLNHIVAVSFTVI